MLLLGFCPVQQLGFRCISQQPIASVSLALQSAYNGVAQGFGSMPMTSGGYGQAAFAQAGMSPYGQTAINFQSGQKRDAGYDQARVTWQSVGVNSNVEHGSQ